MKDSASFRVINNTEKTLIRKSVSKISSNVLPFLDSLKDVLYISFNQKSSGNLNPKIFLLNQKHKSLVEEIEDKDLINEAGLYIGFIKKGNFLISLEFLEYLYKNHNVSDLKRFWTNIRGEKSVLYGNNIRKEMVDKIPEDLKRDDFVLIFNQLNEIIAFCRSKVNRDEIYDLKPKEVIAINLIDKGKYLRRKQ
jgi:ribosome biogenesis protein Nip4